MKALRHLARLLAVTLPLAAGGPAAAQSVGEIQRLQVLPGYEMRAPTAAWDGSRYIVVFEAFPERQPDRADLYVALVDPEGALIGGDVRPLGLGGAPVPQTPDVAVHRASGGAMVAFLSKSGPFSDVEVAWFDPDVPATRPEGRLALTAGDDAELPPKIAAADDGYLVMWSTVKLSGGTTVTGQRLGPDGALVDAAPEGIRGRSNAAENRPYVVGAGDRFWVTWDEADADDVDGFVTTVLWDGPFRFQAPVRVAQGAGRQSGLTVAPLGGAHYVVWQDFARTVPDAWGARVQDDLQTDVGPHIVTQVDGNTNAPEVAGDAEGALVVWQSLREGRTRGVVRAGRIDTAGRRLEPEGLEVLAATENVFEPAVAKGPDDQYLVLGIEDGAVTRLVFAVVDTDLAAVPDPPPDAGVVLPDSGNPRRDAGFPDAGAPDAGPADAGPADAGARPPSARDEGCRQVPADAGILWAMLALAPLFARRR